MEWDGFSYRSIGSGVSMARGRRRCVNYYYRRLPTSHYPLPTTKIPSAYYLLSGTYLLLTYYLRSTHDLLPTIYYLLRDYYLLPTYYLLYQYQYGGMWKLARSRVEGSRH